MPWINKASLALYIATHHCHKGLARAATAAASEIRKEYCAVEFVSVIEASKLVAIKIESRSLTPSP